MLSYTVIFSDLATCSWLKRGSSVTRYDTTDLDKTEDKPSHDHVTQQPFPDKLVKKKPVGTSYTLFP